MKSYAIFQQYIWLVNTIHKFGKLTLAEINHHWLDTDMSEGLPIARSTFNRHRDAILDMFGVVRFDFIMDKNNKLYINEVNTIPGSMANYLFKDFKYKKLIDNIVLMGLIRNEKDSQLIKRFDSTVLSGDFDFNK